MKIVNFLILIFCFFLMIWCILSVINTGPEPKWSGNNYDLKHVAGILRSGFIGVIAGIGFFTELLYFSLLSLKK